MRDVEYEKRAAAEAAAALVENGAVVGLGTGSTVAYLLPALAERKLELSAVATSIQTEKAARELGIALRPFDRLERLDIAIDGADQIDPTGWLVKGGGGAHTREKIVASAAERFVVIASSDKLVDALSPPVPLELMAYGAASTLERLEHAQLRDVPPSPDGGLIADYRGEFSGPAALAAWLDGVPGVVDHGLFPPELVSEILVASGSEVQQIVPAARRS